MVLIILYFEFMFLYEIIAEYTSMFKDKAFFDIIFMFSPLFLVTIGTKSS